jgi:hypothetical protein
MPELPTTVIPTVSLIAVLPMEVMTPTPAKTTAKPKKSEELLWWLG